MPLPHQLRKKNRIEMPLDQRGVRDVVSLGRYNYQKVGQPLPDHRHLGCIEICYLEKGRQTYRLGHRYHRLKGGDVFVSLPGEYHSSGKFPEEKGVLYWMIIRTNKRGPFLGLPREQGDPLLQSLLKIPVRHFPGSLEMKRHLDAITFLYHEKETPASTFAMANHTGAFLLEVITCADRTRSTARTSSFQSVIRYIESNLDQKISIPQLAKLSRLSVPRFHVRFKQETGLPPGEYVLRAKIDQACHRLKNEGNTITQIAYDLGFGSSQYFATVFRQFVGRCPSQYRSKSKITIDRTKP